MLTSRGNGISTTKQLLGYGDNDSWSRPTCNLKAQHVWSTDDILPQQESEPNRGNSRHLTPAGMLRNWHRHPLSDHRASEVPLSTYTGAISGPHKNGHRYCGEGKELSPFLRKARKETRICKSYTGKTNIFHGIQCIQRLLYIIQGRHFGQYMRWLAWKPKPLWSTALLFWN